MGRSSKKHKPSTQMRTTIQCCFKSRECDGCVCLGPFSHCVASSLLPVSLYPSLGITVLSEPPISFLKPPRTSWLCALIQDSSCAPEDIPSFPGPHPCAHLHRAGAPTAHTQREEPALLQTALSDSSCLSLVKCTDPGASGLAENHRLSTYKRHALGQGSYFS